MACGQRMKTLPIGTSRVLQSLRTRDPSIRRLEELIDMAIR